MREIDSADCGEWEQSIISPGSRESRETQDECWNILYLQGFSDH